VVDLDTDFCSDEGCNLFMKACWFQVKYLSVNQFITVVAIILSDKFVKAECFCYVGQSVAIVMERINPINPFSLPKQIDLGFVKDDILPSPRT
jgi:hypothetical protein